MTQYLIDGISIIIPCFNEENRIIMTVMDAYNYCEKNFTNYEIIIVNDGSTDSTCERIRPYLTEKINLMGYKVNKGKGFAVKTGVDAAFYNVVLFMDADNATRMDMFDRFFPHIDDYDLLVSSRNLSDSNIVVKQPLHRTFMGRVFATLVRMTIGTTIRDTQNGYKVFCTKKAKNLFNNQMCERFAFDVELIMKAEKQGLKIKEVPVDWYNDNESKVNGLKDIFKMFEDLVFIWRMKNQK